MSAKFPSEKRRNFRPRFENPAGWSTLLIASTTALNWLSTASFAITPSITVNASRYQQEGFIESAKLNSLDAQAYIADIIEKIASG
ncbi:transposase domain-containing protein [Sphingomonas oleivorans]|uniref:transposase domain-containing protein n=1 Tax=Sphingomonas oleivorans TaxID=1735121 RepID=UPI001FAF759C|nr:transposase domain-containing protein [Sphingomonas oleivorans]